MIIILFFLVIFGKTHGLIGKFESPVITSKFPLMDEIEKLAKDQNLTVCPASKIHMRICNIVYGDILIKGFTEDSNVAPYYHITHLFGRLRMRENNRYSLGIFPSLKFIGATNFGQDDDQPLISIVLNTELRHLGFESIEMIRTKFNGPPLVVYGNQDYQMPLLLEDQLLRAMNRTRAQGIWTQTFAEDHVVERKVDFKREEEFQESKTNLVSYTFSLNIIHLAVNLIPLILTILFSLAVFYYFYHGRVMSKMQKKYSCQHEYTEAIVATNVPPPSTDGIQGETTATPILTKDTTILGK